MSVDHTESERPSTVSSEPVHEGRQKTPPVAKQSSAAHGLVVGGRGGPEDELLNDGQEEVFSRAEVELGKIEHKTEAGGDSHDIAPFGRPS